MRNFSEKLEILAKNREDVQKLNKMSKDWKYFQQKKVQKYQKLSNTRKMFKN